MTEPSSPAQKAICTRSPGRGRACRHRMQAEVIAVAAPEQDVGVTLELAFRQPTNPISASAASYIRRAPCRLDTDVVDASRPPLALPRAPAAHVALEHAGARDVNASRYGNIPTARVGEPDDHAGERADRYRSRSASRRRRSAHRVGIRRLDLSGRSVSFRQHERRRQLGERCCPPVGDDRLPDLLAERVRRNPRRGVRQDRTG